VLPEVQGHVLDENAAKASAEAPAFRLILPRLRDFQPFPDLTAPARLLKWFRLSNPKEAVMPNSHPIKQEDPRKKQQEKSRPHSTRTPAVDTNPPRPYPETGAPA
jgi:hypothetical protein